MNEAVIIAVIGLLAAPVASFITWLANRKKSIGDIYATLTDSAQSAVETMQNTMEALHDELNAAQAKIEILIQENQKMQEELSKLRQQNLLLLEENHSLHKKVDEMVRVLNASSPESSPHDS